MIDTSQQIAAGCPANQAVAAPGPFRRALMHWPIVFFVFCVVPSQRAFADPQSSSSEKERRSGLAPGSTERKVSLIRFTDVQQQDQAGSEDATEQPKLSSAYSSRREQGAVPPPPNRDEDTTSADSKNEQTGDTDGPDESSESEASQDQAAAKVPPAPVEGDLGSGKPDDDADEPLSLQTILESTIANYPEIQAAFQLREIVDGDRLSAEGAFDTKFKIDSENTPVGFYESYRNSIGLEKPTYNGGSVFGGYRQGRGDIEPWFLDRNTNAGGEFKIGLNAPLARNRDIDRRRADIWRATWQQRAAVPQIRTDLIRARQLAEFTYWTWVAAGKKLDIAMELLRIAEDRQKGILKRIEAGDLKRIERVDNERVIFDRRAKVISARVKFEQAAAKLALFYRDSDGQPQLPEPNQLADFPKVTESVDQPTVQARIAESVSLRPEIELLDIELSTLAIDLAEARNNLLPQIDFEIAASQDIGAPTSAVAAASSSGSGALFAFFDEKDQFKLDVNLNLKQAVQRRKARGKIQAIAGKQSQVRIKRQFTVDKISAEVRQALALVNGSRERIEQANRGRKASRELLKAIRFEDEEGNVSLFELNIREKQLADAELLFIEAEEAYYAAIATLNATIGRSFEAFDN